MTDRTVRFTESFFDRLEELLPNERADLCITRDTVAAVKKVSVRELRNNGGEVIDRVIGGDTFVVTRDGHEVAELRPLRPRPLDAATLLGRWRRLPLVDPIRFRDDIDAVLDASL